MPILDRASAEDTLRKWVSGFGRNAGRGVPYILDERYRKRLFPKSNRNAAVAEELAAPEIQEMEQHLRRILEEEERQRAEDIAGQVDVLDIRLQPMDEFFGGRGRAGD